MNSILPVSISGDDAPNYRQDALWVRLQQFTLDDPESALPFSLRLARDNGWSRHYSVRVIAEYKKFCYLALTTAGEVTPSDAVDQAWHLHLVYTQSYWDEFCGQVLCFPLHHNPTRGGAEQRDRFRGQYSRTLDTYRHIFRAPPPNDIWPPVDARFANSSAFRRVDTASFWVLPKPQLRLWAQRKVRTSV